MTNEMLSKFEEVKEEYSRFYGGELFLFHKFENNSEEMRTGIGVKMSPDETISPIIYLPTDMFTLCSADSIIEEINSLYKSITENEDELRTLNILDFVSKDNIEKYCIPRIYGINNLQQIIAQDDVYSIVHDFVVVYYLPILKNNEGIRSIRITKKLCDALDIDKEKMNKNAIDNLHKDYELISMTELLNQMFDTEIYTEESDSFGISLYVLSNKEKCHGASVIINDRILDEIWTKLDQDYIIIPSSIHEVLILPINNYVSYSEIKNMVKDINSNVVADKDVLTNTIYKYSEGKLWIMIGDKDND